MYRSVIFFLLRNKSCDIDAFFRRHGLSITLGYFQLHLLFRLRCGTRQTCFVTFIFCLKFEKCKDIKSTFTLEEKIGQDQLKPWYGSDNFCKEQLSFTLQDKTGPDPSKKWPVWYGYTLE